MTRTSPSTLEAALAAARDSGDTAAVAHTQLLLAQHALLQSAPDLVLTLDRLEDAHHSFEAVGDHEGTASATWLLAQVQVALGMPGPAVQGLRQATALYVSLGKHEHAEQCRGMVSAIRAGLDRSVTRAASEDERGHALFQRARVFLAAGDAGRARSDLEAAWPLCAGSDDAVAAVGVALADLLQADDANREDAEWAVEVLGLALAAARRMQLSDDAILAIVERLEDARRRR